MADVIRQKNTGGRLLIHLLVPGSHEHTPEVFGCYTERYRVTNHDVGCSTAAGDHNRRVKVLLDPNNAPMAAMEFGRLGVPDQRTQIRRLHSR